MWTAPPEGTETVRCSVRITSSRQAASASVGARTRTRARISAALESDVIMVLNLFQRPALLLIDVEQLAPQLGVERVLFDLRAGFGDGRVDGPQTLAQRDQ